MKKRTDFRLRAIIENTITAALWFLYLQLLLPSIVATVTTGSHGQLFKTIGTCIACMVLIAAIVTAWSFANIYISGKFNANSSWNRLTASKAETDHYQLGHNFGLNRKELGTLQQASVLLLDYNKENNSVSIEKTSLF